MVRINRDRRHVIAVTAYVVRHNILTDHTRGKHLRTPRFVARSNQVQPRLSVTES
jgi:hypothetical protein